MNWYVNTVCYHDNSCQPAIGENGKSFRFLATYYDLLFQNLTNEEVPEEYLEEGFQIFSEMNTELYEISLEVVNASRDFPEVREALITMDSDFYQQTAETLNAFCDKYVQLIDNYHKKAFSQN